MPNQLSIPFKVGYTAPIREAVNDYLLAHGEAHPEEFKWDIGRWEKLRQNAISGVVHVNQVDALLTYHSQLVSILTKLPADIGLEVAYHRVFSPPRSVPEDTLHDLQFERCSVLLNLGALYSQLAAAEDRSKDEGIKRAIAHFKNAAGVFSFLAENALPKLVVPHGEEIPIDLTEPFINSLEQLMLAQAQECAWQMARTSYKNGTKAKLSTQVAAYYGASLDFIHSDSEVKSIFPSSWIAHLEVKQLHFSAVAQYRKSMEESEANQYGVEQARLGESLALAKRAYDVARRGRVADAVMQDTKSLLDQVQSDYTRCERDNDLIYHHDVPSLSTLRPISGASVVASTIPASLDDPQKQLGNEDTIFGSMISLGARQAIDIYNENRKDLIQNLVFDEADKLTQEADKVLHNLQLPASLEALDQVVGLPPSLLKSAEEVRKQNGPHFVDSSLSDLEKLAQVNARLLEEVMDLLDQEFEEDELIRETLGVLRPPSSEANRSFIDKHDKYRHILQQATQSDAEVLRKWDDYADSIDQLMLPPEKLEKLLPQTTGQSRSGSDTQRHARAIRVALESLESLKRTRDETRRRCERLMNADDITERIMRTATGFEKWTVVTPPMLQDVMDDEMKKYDKFIQDMKDNEANQKALLDQITVRNEAFLKSRKNEGAVQARKETIQNLNTAFMGYQEIVRNLEEGLKFYNNMVGILTKFRDSCKTWCLERSSEAHALSTSTQELVASEPDQQPFEEDEKEEEEVETRLHVEPLAPESPVVERQPELLPQATFVEPQATPMKSLRKPRAPKTVQRAPPAMLPQMPDVPTTLPMSPTVSTPTTKKKVAVGLPSLNSGEWESSDLPPPPGQGKVRR